ncbi:hypothetical protein [Bradyrhizobium erythrophlei]|uniref:Uncharacterized protein n=1 Tax=Bradyrhizobium erythrophlei TaxID=1437360 RepID=A0A1H4YC82_9BRAD|nr:hypothetical protein [Bradyrhizobium erythrophlei]SED15509.1 hypothetical protein SAMN05444164_3882 [Bradyrhizobium erythrophlei]
MKNPADSPLTIEAYLHDAVMQFRRSSGLTGPMRLTDRRVATVLEAKLRKMIGTKPNYCRPEIVFDRDNVVALEAEEMRAAGHARYTAFGA